MIRIGVFVLQTLVGWLLLVHMISGGARAAEFCALTVSVTEPDGKPIRSTMVELIDPAGSVVRREMMVGPVLKICDFGFGPHTLRIGTNECLPTAVSNLRVILGVPLHLDVMMNSCGYRYSGRSGCLLYFRVADANGGSVPDVDFSPRVTDGSSRTDSYGRFQSLFVGDRDFTFTKSGFYPTTVHVHCRGTEEIDQGVVLRKLGE